MEVGVEGRMGEILHRAVNPQWEGTLKHRREGDAAVPGKSNSDTGKNQFHGLK